MYLITKGGWEVPWKWAVNVPHEVKNSFNLGKDDGPAYITDGKMLIGNILVVMKIYQALEPPLLAKNKPIIGLT